MTHPTTNPQGDFTWYELMTSDPGAAAAFYGAVIGWTCKDSGQTGMDYREWWMGDCPIGGLMKMPDGAPMPPCWTGYVAVDDIIAGIENVKAAGGTVHIGPQEVPGVGQFAFISDPQGAMLYIMQDSSGEESMAFAKYEPQVGHCAWNELATTDPAGAKAFYGKQFGWEKQGETDMGPMGAYELLQAPGERPYGVGAVYKKVPEDPQSHWLFYFRVPDIDAAAERIRAGGGRIHIEAMEIPGGDFSLIAADPQGAFFGLVGARK